MTNFEYIKSLSKEELAAYLDKHFAYIYDAPWDIWWNGNYCSKCETVMAKLLNEDREIPCGWCEVHKKCKYFQELDSTPDSKQVIKMWLEKEWGGMNV